MTQTGRRSTLCSICDIHQKEKNNKVQLTWKTASELNNKGFEVQRSTDGENFEPIGFVEGYGTTLERQNYAFTDEAIQFNMTYYYRLKQIDFDGRYEVSKVVIAKVEDQSYTLSKFYPNPVTSTTRLTYFSDRDNDITVNVYNIAGQLQFSNNQTIAEGENLLEFDFESLAIGTYFVHFINNDSNNRRVVRKFMKH